MRKIMLVWLASLVLVAMTSFAVAQQRFAQPRVVSGADIGFRVEGTDLSGRPTGTFMVRVNGEWMEVGSTMRVHPAN
jgi:hypothetical protein